MNTLYSDFIQKHLDILSFRDLAPKTISTYLSYLDEFLNWVEKELSGKILSEVSYEEIRIYLRYLKDGAGCHGTDLLFLKPERCPFQPAELSCHRRDDHCL
ncbi:hypothetical protein FYJ45_25690 [Eisenbergiella tayi]|uniref:Core-binding (CB) domain-containing protein n=1 Tax=Eisenbergiella porci TaxID=2652274 RepID=A0A6N7W8C2_9FIRM|nr:phage integrase N-terminal SAM-like domain-containing protein [Eisenbergiella porci]MSS91496.1 hypothetical protein [Eisenbergiella porci]